MRVLFIINGLRLGGMERQFVELIKCLYCMGIETYLAVFSGSEQSGSVIRPYLFSDALCVRKKKGLMIIEVLRLLKESKRIQPDVYHVQDSLSALYIMLSSKLLGIPLVNGCVRHSGVTKGIEYHFERLLIMASDAVIANSCAGLKYYHVNGLVLYNFINRDRFRECNHNLRNVIMVANFTTYKDHMTVILAASKLLNEGEIDKVGFVGEGSTLQYCKSAIGKDNFADRFHFYGSVVEVEDVIVDYGIGVMCSTIKYKEGISNSILEYMGSGLIAIGSNIGGTPEIITSGINGYLVEPESIDSLYKAILYILKHSDKMDDIRRNAKTTLETQFDPELNSKKLLSLYAFLKNR